MSKKDEALKLALEALEVATTPLAKDRQEVLRARAAIREAQAEQPAQQEPGAWIPITEWRWNNDAGTWEGLTDTSPPASKPFVGLTEEERMDVLLALNWDKRLTHMDTARAIEAKLREKNA